MLYYNITHSVGSLNGTLAKLEWNSGLLKVKPMPYAARGVLSLTRIPSAAQGFRLVVSI